MNDLYHEAILDEAQAPKNKGKLADADTTVSQHNISCGDQLTVSLKLDATKTKIEDIRWEGDGCIISVSHMSALSEMVKQKTLADVLKLTEADMLKLLGLESISSGRKKCLLISLVTVQKAIQQVQPQE